MTRTKDKLTGDDLAVALAIRLRMGSNAAKLDARPGVDCLIVGIESGIRLARSCPGLADDLLQGVAIPVDVDSLAEVIRGVQRG